MIPPKKKISLISEVWWGWEINHLPDNVNKKRCHRALIVHKCYVQWWRAYWIFNTGENGRSHHPKIVELGGPKISTIENDSWSLVIFSLNWSLWNISRVKPRVEGTSSCPTEPWLNVDFTSVFFLGLTSGLWWLGVV